MTSGWLFLGIVTLMCVGVFLNGLRFARMTQNPLAGRKMLGQPIEGSELSTKQVQRIGQLQMIVAPIFLLFSAALCFGAFGPVEGIQVIELN